MGFSASDPEIQQYKRELEGGKSGLWVLKNPEGKYVWLDVVDVLNTGNTSAVPPDKYHDAVAVTGAMLRDFQSFLTTKPPRRIAPIIDPVLGDKRVLMKLMTDMGRGEAIQYSQDLGIEHDDVGIPLKQEIDLKSEALDVDDILPNMRFEETISTLKEGNDIVKNANEEPWTISHQDMQNYFQHATDVSQASSILRSFLNLANWAKSEYQNWAKGRGAPQVDVSITDDTTLKVEEDIEKEEDMTIQEEVRDVIKNEESSNQSPETDLDAGYQTWVQNHLGMRAQNPVARKPQTASTGDEIDLYSVQKKLKSDQN
ncbi:hypothetical protein AA313_de0206375 [Arthrobotrys entomopaga]|nr:hypothetical protein AA313_de0206375 [Arthrobotrys entomopaga]